MAKKRGVVPLILLIIVALFFLFLNAPFRERVLLASDPLYLSYYKTTALKLQFALKGYTLKIVKLSLADLFDPSLVVQHLTVDKHTNYLITSPLVSSVIQKSGEVKAIAIGVKGDYFRASFLSERESGWDDVAFSLSKQQRQNPLPTALLYEKSGYHYHSFSEAYSRGALEEIEVESASEKEAASVVKELYEKGVLYVVVPYVKHLNWYTNALEAHQMRWIVDQKMERVVPKKQLAGVVQDNMVASFLLYISNGEPKESPLVRDYKGAGSLF